MPSRDPLIRHAITPPTFDKGKLSRERLVDAIHANIPRKLIAIAAPPGYGKTTLLAEFGQETELGVCWFRLSEGDWDVMRFAQVLAASLQERFRRLRGLPDLTALANSSPEALALAFSSLIGGRSARPSSLCLTTSTWSTALRLCWPSWRPSWKPCPNRLW
jgi:LuxR family maltose regulon positive regulatory protein